MGASRSGTAPADAVPPSTTAEVDTTILSRDEHSAPRYGPTTLTALLEVPRHMAPRLRPLAEQMLAAGNADAVIAEALTREAERLAAIDDALAEQPAGSTEPGESEMPHLAPVPEYPLHQIPDPLAAVVWSGVAAGLPAPYVAAGGLAALAYIARDCRAWVSESWIEAPALWLVALGNAGSGKSPGWRYGWVQVWAVERDLHAAWEAEMATWRATPPGDREAPPPHSTHVLTDATPEVLIRRLSEAGPQIIAVDELRGWLGGLGRYASGGVEREIGLLLGCWDAGAPVRYDRVGGDVSLVASDPAVSVIGTLQAEDHRLLGGVASGFRARWLPHLGGSEQPVAGGGDLARWNAVIRPLGTDPPARRLCLAGEARQRWRDAQDRWRAGAADASPGMRAACLKADRQALRVATCLAVAMGARDEIPTDAMAGAVAVVDYCLGCWAAIPEGEELTLSRTEERLAPAVDRLAAWLEAREGRRARREQIYRAHVAGVRTASALDALLEHYEAVYPGSVETGESTGGRRPVIVHAPRRQRRAGLPAPAQEVATMTPGAGPSKLAGNRGSGEEVARKATRVQEVPKVQEVGAPAPPGRLLAALERERRRLVGETPEETEKPEPISEDEARWMAGQIGPAALEALGELTPGQRVRARPAVARMLRDGAPDGEIAAAIRDAAA